LIPMRFMMNASESQNASIRFCCTISNITFGFVSYAALHFRCTIRGGYAPSASAHTSEYAAFY